MSISAHSSARGIVVSRVGSWAQSTTTMLRITKTTTTHSLKLLPSNSTEYTKTVRIATKAARLRQRYVWIEKVNSKLRLWQEGWILRVRGGRTVG